MYHFQYTVTYKRKLQVSMSFAHQGDTIGILQGRLSMKKNIRSYQAVKHFVDTFSRLDTMQQCVSQYTQVYHVARCLTRA